ncbi:cytochrome P450 [Daedaleopsis nitida]|nr:cytochrome P450 [Daedaleopsis nitida]
MTDVQTVLYALLALAAAVYVHRWRTVPLSAIPTVGGPSAPILSFWTASKFMLDPRALVMEGYRKFHGSVFKIALPDMWLVVLTGSKLVDELRKYGDDMMSFTGGVEALIQMRFTLGKTALDQQFHVEIIRDRLMRTLVTVMPEVVDELTVAIAEYLPADDKEWVTVKPMEFIQRMVARTSNRAFVGLPRCTVGRNKEFLELAIAFTFNIFKDKLIINALPFEFMKTFYGKHFSQAKKSVREASPYLQPLIDERRALLAEHGDEWPGKANDMLQWTLEQAIQRNDSDEDVVSRVLLTNFASIHSTSTSLTMALYDLAAAPEYIQPLRDEIEPIIAAQGWKKAAIHKMYKVDSFLKESQRVNGIGLFCMTRMAMKDVTFSDGTVIPKDTVVVAGMYPMHQDEEFYPNAATFDPFRFSRMRELDGEGTMHQFVHTSVEYSAWSHGKHSCPGRFFAANELKAMLAYIVVHYDLKIAGDGGRPENQFLGASIFPNPNGEIMFRKRQTSV